MKEPRPSINEILDEHVGRQIGAKTGLRRKRVETVTAHFRRCIDDVGEDVISDASRAMLELERQFCAEDAFCRILNAGDLLLVLREYVRESWLLSDLRDRAVQLRFADALQMLILKQHLASPQEFALIGIHVLTAIINAKAELTAERLRTK